MTKTAPKSKQKQLSFRVISYNLLSSSLVHPNIQKQCNPDNLRSDSRFSRILKKLEVEMERKAILCLQEVTINWIGKLHIWMQERDYMMVTASYGTKFNGFMGIAIAWPVNSFKARRISIDHIAETKQWASNISAQVVPCRQSRTPLTSISLPSSIFFGIFRRVLNLFTDFSGLGFFLHDNYKGASIDPWQNSRSKNNQMIFIEFTCTHTQSSFCVATYHMPCQFKCPWTMTIHTSLSFQHAQRLAEKRPLVYAGDFNFQPHSPQYALVMSGRMDKMNPAYPQAPPKEKSLNWGVDLAYPMKSAYKEYCGKEPALTNWSGVTPTGSFTGTLDYIFHTSNLAPTDVVQLGDRNTIKGGGPFPSKYQPSDHLMIGSSFRLN